MDYNVNADLPGKRKIFDSTLTSNLLKEIYKEDPYYLFSLKT